MLQFFFHKRAPLNKFLRDEEKVLLSTSTFLCAAKCTMSCHSFQTDLTSNGDLFDPSICDLLLDSSANEKDVFESGDWTYLEAVPPFQTSMKPEEELSNVPDLLVSV